MLCLLLSESELTEFKNFQNQLPALICDHECWKDINPLSFRTRNEEKLSLERQRKILYYLQLKPCVAYKISLWYSAHAPSNSIEMTTFIKIRHSQQPLITGEPKGRYNLSIKIFRSNTYPMIWDQIQGS